MVPKEGGKYRMWAARCIQPCAWTLHVSRGWGQGGSAPVTSVPPGAGLRSSMFDDGYLLWKLPNELQDRYPAPKQYYHNYYKLN